MPMDYLRQLELLDPKQIGKRSVSLVGAGATGSYVALMLAQLGWGNTPQGQGVLKVFDGDKVEEHNIANQAYEPAHVGMPKVEALAEIIRRKCNFDIEVHNEMVSDQSSAKANYVFLLTDTMKSRSEIFDKCLQFSFDTDLVIETRMGLRDGRVYAFNPHSTDQVEAWKATLYSDDVAETSRCGASASIITTVNFLASLATARLVQHFNEQYGSDNLRGDKGASFMWNEVHFSLYPETFYMRCFGDPEPVIAQRTTFAT